MHKIRLRRVWKLQDQATSSDSVACFLRKFNRPTGLAGQDVFLAVESRVPLHSVLLGEHELLSSPDSLTLRTPAAHLLQPHNTLSITLEAAPQTDFDTLADVWLEIDD
ncbi:MAG TPA: hypothetical protein DDW52_16155 [Planctomycetaceae bacterium]|nr:hypothetical protein [Planctomycetaceae bacterium]